jgi:hypothetical protein
MTTKKVCKTCGINVPLFRIEVILCSGQLTIQECVVFKLVYLSTNILISLRTENDRIFKSSFIYLSIYLRDTAKYKVPVFFVFRPPTQKIIFPPMVCGIIISVIQWAHKV